MLAMLSCVGEGGGSHHARASLVTIACVVNTRKHIFCYHTLDMLARRGM